MYDPTIHRKTIARHLRAADFVEDRSLLVPANLKLVIDEAVRLGSVGLVPLTLNKGVLRSKPVYQVRGLAHNLVIRHVTANIRLVTRVQQDNRRFIVDCIRTLMKEGTAFRVYKFDIKSFYENVRVEEILDKLSTDLAFSGQSVRALRSLFGELCLAGVTGLPRGMAISATLSEYLMRSFDRDASSGLGVWYYSRFVDDILLITDGREDTAEFISLLETFMPKGLIFNEKSKYFSFGSFKKPVPIQNEHTFDFLGYSFGIGHVSRDADGRFRRAVSLDIAPSKVARIKTRVIRSLVTYAKDKNFDDLRDRIRILTSNYKFEDRTTGAQRASGIYFNYPLIDAGHSGALRDLDQFLRKALSSPHPKNRTRPALAKNHRELLLGLTFVSGHSKKRFFSFSPARLATLTACWHYA